MDRSTINGTISQFSAEINVPEQLGKVKGGRAKGKSVESERINRHLDNIRIQIGKHYWALVLPFPTANRNILSNPPSA